MGIHVETLDAEHYTQADLEQIAQLRQMIWPKAGYDRVAAAQAYAQELTADRSPRAQRRCYHVARDAGQIVATGLTFAREIGTPVGRRTIMGLAAVCSHPSVRGRGFGVAVVRGAFERVTSGQFGAALFQTTPPVTSFYEKLGACAVTNPLINSLADDPTAYPFWDGAVMRYPAAAPWPDGTIDLLGPGY